MVDKKRVKVKKARRSLIILSKWPDLDKLDELMKDDFPSKTNRSYPFDVPTLEGYPHSRGRKGTRKKLVNSGNCNVLASYRRRHTGCGPQREENE